MVLCQYLALDIHLKGPQRMGMGREREIWVKGMTGSHALSYGIAELCIVQALSIPINHDYT